jgi:hypothetical protein
MKADKRKILCSLLKKLLEISISLQLDKIKFWNNKQKTIQRMKTNKVKIKIKVIYFL